MSISTLEICLDSVDVINVCVSPIVDRIEPFYRFSISGLNPLLGLIRVAKRPIIGNIATIKDNHV